MREIGKQLFEDIRRQAESIINPKINDELDLKLKYKFDWQMNECLGTSRYDLLPMRNSRTTRTGSFYVSGAISS